MSTTKGSNRGKIALITGASGGIGYELARLFARDGYDLVLVARGEDKLNKMKAAWEAQLGILVRVIAKDLSQPGAAQEIFDELQRDDRAVDILVNNAGFTISGEFAQTDLQSQDELLQVNIVALTQLTRLFLPGMVQRGAGKVLNIASTAAFLPGPLMATYYASKAFVLSFSEAIAEELAGTGVTVTVLCPGATQTGFARRGNVENSRLFTGKGVMDAKTVAKIGYRALMRGQTTVIAGLSNWIQAEALRLAPRKLAPKAVLRAHDRE